MDRVWTEDAERRAGADIPAELRFASTNTLAERMLEWAFEAAVPAR